MDIILYFAARQLGLCKQSASAVRGYCSVGIGRLGPSHATASLHYCTSRDGGQFFKLCFNG